MTSDINSESSSGCSNTDSTVALWPLFLTWYLCSRIWLENLTARPRRPLRRRLVDPIYVRILHSNPSFHPPTLFSHVCIHSTGALLYHKCQILMFSFQCSFTCELLHIAHFKSGDPFRTLFLFQSDNKYLEVIFQTLVYKWFYCCILDVHSSYIPHPLFSFDSQPDTLL